MSDFLLDVGGTTRAVKLTASSAPPALGTAQATELTAGCYELRGDGPFVVVPPGQQSTVDPTIFPRGDYGLPVPIFHRGGTLNMATVGGAVVTVVIVPILSISEARARLSTARLQETIRAGGGVVEVDL